MITSGPAVATSSMLDVAIVLKVKIVPTVLHAVVYFIFEKKKQNIWNL